MQHRILGKKISETWLIGLALSAYRARQLGNSWRPVDEGWDQIQLGPVAIILGQSAQTVA